MNLSEFFDTYHEASLYLKYSIFRIFPSLPPWCHLCKLSYLWQQFLPFKSGNVSKIEATWKGRWFLRKQTQHCHFCIVTIWKHFLVVSLWKHSIFLRLQSGISSFQLSGIFFSNSLHFSCFVCHRKKNISKASSHILSLIPVKFLLLWDV